MRRLLVPCAALLALACARPDAGGPAAAYRAFADAVEARDAAGAWGLLSSDTRAWLDARARAVSAAAPGIVEGSGRDLLLGDAALAQRAPGAVTVLRESRDAAVLRVGGEGGGEVELVREGDAWRLRVPAPPAP